ncbi:MAG: hypothetical protein NTU95_02075 [Methanothrix sp.]|nr:hypothetical protein [Methanothrix sp.]
MQRISPLLSTFLLFYSPWRADAEALKLQARLEDLTVWQMDAEAARRKARERKAEGLGMRR